MKFEAFFQKGCMILIHFQGRQQHKRSATAHYRSTLRKAVPGGALRVGRGVKRRSVRAKHEMYACILSDEEALS